MYCSKPSIGEEEIEAARRVLSSEILLNGPELEAFEEKFCTYTKSNDAAGVSSGTAALILALEGLGVGGGDTVLVPEITASPTAKAIWGVGATPIPVPIDDNYIIDIEKASKFIKYNTKAVIVVHLYGYPANMKLWKEFCEKRNLLLIEDCAQAAGAVFEGNYVGVFGDAGCFSFYPTKNMTVGGDGGMVIGGKKLVNYVKAHRNHYFRMSEISAAIGIEQLKKLPGFIKKRNEIASKYNRALNLPDFSLEDCVHSYHLYVIKVPNRHEVINKMKKSGVHCGVHYPYSITNSKQHPLDYGKVEHSRRCLSIPLYPSLTEEEQKIIIRELEQLWGV